ncbi:hypothetical protein L1766_06955 [Thermovorax subterraneus]|nr:hypothetical protein [Thermovorax subterraneus]
MDIKRLIALFIILSSFLYGCSNVHKKAHQNEAVTKVELLYADFFTPAIVDDRLFVAVKSKKAKDDMCDILIERNIKTGEEKLIFESKYELGNVQGVKANEKWLVWADGDVWGSEVKFYAKNLKTGEVKLIYSKGEKESITVPELWRDYLVWATDYDATDGNRISEIVLLNLENGQMKKVGTIRNTCFINNFVSINNGRIIWADRDDKMNYYHIFDINTSKTTSYEVPGNIIGEAYLVEGKIYSVDLKYGTEYPTENKLYVYDLATNEHKIVDENITRLRVFNNGLAYKKDKWKIYLNHKNLRPVDLDLGFEPLHYYVTGEGKYLVTGQSFFEEQRSVIYIIYPEKF